MKIENIFIVIEGTLKVATRFHGKIQFKLTEHIASNKGFSIRPLLNAEGPSLRSSNGVSFCISTFSQKQKAQQ